MTHAESKFVLYRVLGEGYRWRLRSATGETLAASEGAYPTKPDCEADLLAFRGDRHVEAEVLDALTFFAYLGFSVITFAVGDLREPARELPKAIQRSAVRLVRIRR